MEDNSKKSLIPSKEEVESLRKEALIDGNKLKNEINRNRKRKIIKALIIIIVIASFIKIFFDTIQIPNIFGYPVGKVKFYKVTINNEPINVGYETTHKIPIIPYLVNFSSYTYGQNYVDVKNDTDYKIEPGKQYLFDISSYNCFDNNGNQLECMNINQNMKETHDMKYTKVVITRTSNPYEQVYSGKFINDITPYVTKKGVYCVQIYANSEFTETVVYFYVKSK